MYLLKTSGGKLAVKSLALSTCPAGSMPCIVISPSSRICCCSATSPSIVDLTLFGLTFGSLAIMSSMNVSGSL